LLLDFIYFMSMIVFGFFGFLAFRRLGGGAVFGCLMAVAIRFISGPGSIAATDVGRRSDVVSAAKVWI
jgi:hypothetical protein